MSQFRLVALLLVAAAGCYSDAPAQSTLPQPQYVSGPPGGNIDPGYGYNAYSDDPGFQAAEPTVAPAPASSDAVPLEAAPGSAAPRAAAPAPASPPEEEDDDDEASEVAEGSPAPDGAVSPTAGVTDPEIDTTLDGYGQWIDTDDYGQVWRPDATVVGVDFTPYESGGSWEYTDGGWAFACDYPWGWLPFHYGRWAWFHDYWGWVPGHRWSPAWVEWRHGGGVVGWRPRAPRIRDHRGAVPSGRDYHHGSGVVIRDHRHPEQHDSHWRFASVPDFARPHIRSHLYGNPAEGLRVTATVTAPPLRARIPVPTRDLMRSRFAAGGPLTQPGSGRSGGLPQLRDHRSSDMVRGYQLPAQGDRPTRYQPYNPPARTYNAPPAYRPPVRTQPYNPPAHTSQPPVRTYNPPPVRTFTPPTRTFTPHAPPSPPSRSWSPPPSSGSSHGPGGSHGSSGSSSSSSGSHASSGSSHGGGSSHTSGGGGHHR